MDRRQTALTGILLWSSLTVGYEARTDTTDDSPFEAIVIGLSVGLTVINLILVTTVLTCLYARRRTQNTRKEASMQTELNVQRDYERPGNVDTAHEYQELGRMRQMTEHVHQNTRPLNRFDEDVIESNSRQKRLTDIPLTSLATKPRRNPYAELHVMHETRKQRL